MVSQTGHHCRRALFPLTPVRPRLIQLLLEGAMWPDKIEDGIFPFNVALQVERFFGMRQCLPNQPAIALA